MSNKRFSIQENNVLESLKQSNQELDAFIVQKDAGSGKTVRERLLEKQMVEIQADMKNHSDQYREKIQTLQKALESLETNPNAIFEDPEHIVKIQSENLKLHLEVDHLNLDSEELKKKLRKKEIAFEELKKENFKLKSEIANLESNIGQYRDERLFNQATNLNQTLTELANNDSSTSTLIVQPDLSDSEFETDEEDDATSFFMTKINSLANDIENQQEPDHDVHISHLESIFASKEAERLRLESKLNGVDEKNMTVNDKLEKLDKEHLSLNSKHDKLHDDHKRLAANKKDVEMKLEELNMKNKELNSQYKQTMTELQALSVKNGEVRANYHSVFENNCALEKSNAELQNELSVIQKDYHALEFKHQNVAETSEKQIEELQKKHDQYQSQLENTNRRTDDMMDHCKIANNNLATEREKTVELNKKIEDLKTEHEEVQKSYIESKNANIHLQATSESMQSQIHQLTQQMTEVITGRTELLTKITRFETQNEHLNTLLENNKNERKIHVAQITAEFQKRINHLEENTVDSKLHEEIISKFEERHANLESLQIEHDDLKSQQIEAANLLNQKLDEHQNLKKKYESVLADHKSRSKLSSNEAKKMQDDLTENQIKNEAYEEQLQKLHVICQSLKDENAIQKQQVRNLKSKADKYKTKVDELRADKRKLALSACNEIERLSVIIKEKQNNGMKKFQRAVNRLSSIGTAANTPNEDQGNSIDLE